MATQQLGIYLNHQALEIGVVSNHIQCLEVFSTEIIPNQPIHVQVLTAISQLRNDFESIGLIIPRSFKFPSLPTDLAQATGLPVSTGFFGEASALYESKFGKGKHLKDFVAITLGEDVDAGLFIDGTLARGANGLAADFSNMLVNAYGKLYPVKNYFSHQGICDTVTRFLANDYAKSKLREIPYTELTPINVVEAALEKDQIAIHAIDELGRILGLKMSDITNYFSPKIFILSADLPNLAWLIRKSAGKSLQKNLFPIFKGKISVELSSLPTEMEKVVKAVALTA